MTRRFLCALWLSSLPVMALADSLVAARTIRSQSVLSAADVRVVRDDLQAELSDPRQVIGLEARYVLYEGRPITGADLAPPALVDRNQTVTLIYMRGGLEIATEARALGRGGAGDVLRVMNLASRATVSGVVTAAGTVRVGDGPIPEQVD